MININTICKSGQCFRVLNTGNGEYRAIHNGEFKQLECLEDEKNLSGIWKDYFDIGNTAYSLLNKQIENYCERGLAGAEYIREAAEQSRGLRVLRQDPWETLISYIISQRNRIERISSLVERMSEVAGTKLEGLYGDLEQYAFPAAEQIIENKDKLKEIGLGYRYDYVIEAAINWKKNGSEYYNSFDRVKELHGVGNKVANCYCLYGLHQLDKFPVDVWIDKIVYENFNNSLGFLKYFKGTAGILQQYMFYYERSLSNKAVLLIERRNNDGKK